MGKHDDTPMPFGAAPTVLADANRLRDLIDQMQAPPPGERETQKMRADQFRDLLHADRATAAPPVSNVAEVADAPPRQLDDILPPANEQDDACAVANGEPEEAPAVTAAARPTAQPPARWQWIAAAAILAVATALLVMSAV